MACRVEPLAAKLLKKTLSGFERFFLFLSENGLFSFLLFDFVGFVSNRFFSRLCRKVFFETKLAFFGISFFSAAAAAKLIMLVPSTLIRVTTSPTDV